MFCRLDARSLARVAATCSELYKDTPRQSSVVEVLRERAAARGRVCPSRLPPEFTTWAAHLAWLEIEIERRREIEAWSPVASCLEASFFVAEGGRLLGCGADNGPEVLGRGELDGVPNTQVFSTTTPLPALEGSRIRSVVAGNCSIPAVSASGAVYT